MDAAQPAQQVPEAAATQDIDTLRLAKHALDIQLLPELEDAVLKCNAKIDHLLGSLQSSLHAVRAMGVCWPEARCCSRRRAQTTQISLKHFETMHAGVDDLSLAIGASVVVMNQLITKVQQLNEDMKARRTWMAFCLQSRFISLAARAQPVGEIAAQIKDISHSLALLEAAVARLR